MNRAGRPPEPAARDAAPARLPAVGRGTLVTSRRRGVAIGGDAREAVVEIRKIVLEVEETYAAAGRVLARPTRKAVASAVIANPFAGRYVEDVSPLVDLGAELGRLLAERALAALGPDAAVTAYGKGAIVGTNGELEHAAAILHPKFGAPVRAVVGGGPSIIPSTKLVAGPGTLLAMPLVNRDDLWSFDEMDAATVQIPDAPRADEIVVSLVLAAGGRPGARTRKAS